MKKIIMFFLALCIDIYGDIITTNGVVGAMYNEEEKRLYSVRGDLFSKEDIAALDLGVVLNDRSYLLKDYLVDARVLPNTNILAIQSEVEERKFTTFVFPSSSSKEKLYIKSIVRKKDIDDRITLIYRLYPYETISTLDFNRYNDYYKVDNFRVKTLNTPMGLYLSKNEFMEGLELYKIESEGIKYEDDKLLLASRLEDKTKVVDDLLTLDFGSSKLINKLDFSPSFLAREYSYWQEWNWDYQSYPKEVREQLVQLKMLTMNAPIPSYFSYNRSKSILSTNMKLAIAMSNYGKGEEALRILDQHRFSRKNTLEDIEILISIIRSLEFSKDLLDDTYIRTRIYPVLQRVLDGIDSDGRFDIENDNIRVYYNLKVILEESLEKQDILGYLPVEKMKEKLGLLEENINKNYMTPDGIKDTPRSLGANPKNIIYLELYPIEIRGELLKEEWSKYYEPRSGFLKYISDDFIDIEYNLEIARLLYGNNEEKLGEILYSRLREIIQENNNYITPRMHPFEHNEVGIYGDLVYSYLITNYYRGIE